MSLAGNLLLVALDPQTGKIALPSNKTDPMLGGAALLSLVAAGRLGLEGEGRKARVVVVDPTPVDDPELEAAFGRVRQRGRQAPKSAVTRLGRKRKVAVLQDLAREGVVRDQGATFLGFPLARFELVDVARRDDLVSRLRGVLLQGLAPDETTGPLVGLLHAGDLLGLVVERSERGLAKARAKEVAAGDWASDAVREAIAAAQTAVTVAIVTSATAAGTAGN